MLRKNISRYVEAWQLRIQGKKLQEIGRIMGISRERVRQMVQFMMHRTLTSKL